MSLKAEQEQFHEDALNNIVEVLEMWAHQVFTLIFLSAARELENRS